ncbi:MAG: TetR/AcrR family transcriptional regulator [Prolixibacteraceae bacterium]|nr:TetR/AcrR family transcriptional regulator [Prolixibacteraceae bacterium]MBN2650215.1 TetR/AcrR family transcriptional regulator [Prolixibacteraceae bacterium]
MGSTDNGINKKDLNREAILEIAQDIFSRYGYKKTTLDDIANAVRKGKSSLYYYFSSKEDLFQAVIIKEVDILKQSLEKVVFRSLDPEEKLREYILTKLTTYRSLANLYNALENDVAAIGFIEEVKEKNAKDEIRMIKRILIEGVRRDKFQIEDLNLAAIGITTAMKGLEMPLTTGAKHNLNLEVTVDNFVRILCYGIMRRD